MGDKSEPRVRERVWVEKFSHDGDEPVLESTTFVETVRGPDGSAQVVEATETVAAPKEPA